jgi:hypothetical protein
MAGWFLRCSCLCLRLVALLFFSLCVQADDFPSTVYRVDVRDPLGDWMFQRGFQPPGHNTDLLAHVAGISVLNGSSGFVSTTDHYLAAEQIAISRLQQGNPLVWIYEIRAADNFYEVNASLHQAIYQLARRDGHGSVQMTNLESLESLYGHPYEWVADRIASALIRSARAYRLASPSSGANQAGRLIEEPHTYLLNPNYREADTTGNRHPWPVLPDQANVPPDQLHSLQRGVRAIGLGWCAVVMGGLMSPRPVRSASHPVEEDCLQTVTPSGLSLAKVWDSALNLLVLRPVPWETEITEDSGGGQTKPRGCRINVADDLLEVFCPSSADYSHFVVQLKAYGVMFKWVDTSFQGGRTDTLWQRRSSDIPVHKTRWMLRDYQYDMKKVFQPHGGTWSSRIVVAPYFPDLTYSSRQKRASAPVLEPSVFAPVTLPVRAYPGPLPFLGRKAERQ